MAVQAVCAIGASLGLPELNRECEIRILQATNIGGSFLGVSIVRVTAYWDQVWVPVVYGNCQMGMGRDLRLNI